MRALPAWLRRSEWPAALLTLLYVGVALSCVRLQYMSNDDVTIMDFARLGFPVRYMGILLTELMHLGYLVAPGLAWYGLVLYALNALCLFVWLWLGLRVIRPLWLAAAFALALFGFDLRHLAFLDYTATSAMLCTAAAVWASLLVLEGGVAPRRMLVPGLLFMLGMMVRPHGAPGALLFTLPLLLTTALVSWREARGRDALRRLALCGLLFLLPAAGEYGVDAAYRAATMTPQQAEYEAFNAVRGRIQRLSTARKHLLLGDRAALSASALSAKDVHDLYGWYFLDERLYTPAALQALLERAPPVHAKLADWRAGLRQRITSTNPFLLLLCASWPLLLLAALRLRWSVLPALCMPLWYPLLTTGMSLLFIFPERVEHPFVVAAGLASFVIASRLAAPQVAQLRVGRWVAALAVAVALLTTDFNLRDEAFHYDGLARRSARVQANLNQLNRDFAGSVILIQPEWGLPMEMLDPLRPIRLRFQPVQLGWSTFSPRFYRQIGALGIQHGYQLGEALARHDRAYLLGGPSWPSFFIADVQRHQGCTLQARVVKRVDNRLLLFRLQGSGDCAP